MFRILICHFKAFSSSIILSLIITNGIFAGGSSLPTESSILGTLHSEASINVGEVVTLFTVNDKIFVNVINVDSTKSLKVFDALTFEELWHVNDSWHVYRGSEGKNPCIFLTRKVSESRADIKVYDTEGNLLFFKENFQGYLFSSPGGEYIYTDFSVVSINKFRLFDRQGNDIVSGLKTGQVWSAYAFNDSILILSTPSEIRFMNVETGNMIKRIPSLDGQIGIEPRIKTSSDGSFAVINWHKETIGISADLEILWQRHDDISFYDATISENDHFTALLLGGMSSNPINGALMKLVFLNTHTGAELWSDEFENPIGTSRYRNQGMKILDYVLHLVIPYADNMKVNDLNQSSQTRIYSFESESGLYRAKQVNQGFVELSETKQDIVSIDPSANSGNSIVVMQWQNVQE